MHPTLANELSALELPPAPGRLADLTDRIAGAADQWRPVLRHDPRRRWYTRLLRTGSVEVWLLGWTPGQEVPAHDHGGAAGAFTVVDGTLVEDELDPGHLGAPPADQPPGRVGDRLRPRARPRPRQPRQRGGDQRPRPLPARPLRFGLPALGAAR